MGRALLTSQCLRLLKSDNSRYVGHQDYWLGNILNTILPNMGLGSGTTVDDSYFCYLGDCLATIMTSGLLTACSMWILTNRQIYNHLSDFLQPKVVREALPGIAYD